MKTVQKSVLIWYSAEEMFALVTAVEKYPEFLPWCDRATVLERDAGGVTAELGISFGGIHQSFVTRNTHTPPTQVDLKLVRGPFSRLDGRWLFTPVGGGQERACRIELRMDFGFENAALRALVGPVFERIAASLVDAFVKRAEQVYG